MGNELVTAEREYLQEQAELADGLAAHAISRRDSALYRHNPAGALNRVIGDMRHTSTCLRRVIDAARPPLTVMDNCFVRQENLRRLIDNADDRECGDVFQGLKEDLQARNRWEPRYCPREVRRALVTVDLINDPDADLPLLTLVGHIQRLVVRASPTQADKVRRLWQVCDGMQGYDPEYPVPGLTVDELDLELDAGCRGEWFHESLPRLVDRIADRGTLRIWPRGDEVDAGLLAETLAPLARGAPWAPPRLARLTLRVPASCLPADHGAGPWAPWLLVARDVQVRIGDERRQSSTIDCAALLSALTARASPATALSITASRASTLLGPRAAAELRHVAVNGKRRLILDVGTLDLAVVVDEGPARAIGLGAPRVELRCVCQPWRTDVPVVRFVDVLCRSWRAGGSHRLRLRIGRLPVGVLLTGVSHTCTSIYQTLSEHLQACPLDDVVWTLPSLLWAEGFIEQPRLVVNILDDDDDPPGYVTTQRGQQRVVHV